MRRIYALQVLFVTLSALAAQLVLPQGQVACSTFYSLLQCQVAIAMTNNYRWHFTVKEGVSSYSVALQLGDYIDRGDTHGDIFDQIIQGSHRERLLFETAHSLAFLSIDRLGHGCTERDTHLLIIPLRHEHELHKLTQEEFEDLMASCAYVTGALGSDANYECFVNNGCFQHVYHVHLHVIIKGVSLYDELTPETIMQWRLHKKDWRINKLVQDPREIIILKHAPVREIGWFFVDR